MFTTASALALGRRVLPYALGLAAAVALYFVVAGWIDGIKTDAMAAQHAVDQRVIDKLQSDIRLKTAEAKAADQAHARAVETAQSDISNERSKDYETKLAALRARLDQLRRAPTQALAARGGGSEQPDMPGLPDAAREPDDTAGPAGLHGGAVEAPDLNPRDAMLTIGFDADVIAERLISLQQWVADQLKVKR